MTFTQKDKEALSTARAEVQRLERLEQTALGSVAKVVIDAGLRCSDGVDWEHVVCHAGAIRDALAPFDDGVRCAEGKQ